MRDNLRSLVPPGQIGEGNPVPATPDTADARLPDRRPTVAEALQVLAGFHDGTGLTVADCCPSCGQMRPDLDGTLGA